MNTLSIGRTVLIPYLAAIFSIGILSFASPVDAEYHGTGWFVCTFDPNVDMPFPPTEGNLCHFAMAGSRRGNEWRGQGSWVDRDWQPGPLNAIFTITGGGFFCDAPGNHIIYQLHGHADVFVGDYYAGTYYLFMDIWDDPGRDNVRLCLYKKWWDTPPPPWEDPGNIFYFADSYGGLLKGDIKTNPSICE